MPKAQGVLAGTINHSGLFPPIKLHIKDGQLIRIEGGGKYGELWRMLLKNSELREVHYPYMPEAGFFYLYESSLGLNPKVIKSLQRVTSGNGRSGHFH